MVEYRCKTCNHLLAKEEIRDGKLEIKCHKCKTYNTVAVIVGKKPKFDTFRPTVYNNSTIKKSR